MKKLFLLPTPIGTESQIHDFNISQIKEVKFYIVEKAKTARQFLSQNSINVHDKAFIELNKNTKYFVTDEIKEVFKLGEDICLMSEAGCPAVADPGNEIVLYAHKMGFQIIPLVGPSSIILALMASGMNGQHFEFVGYIPINKEDKKRTIKQLEKDSYYNKKAIIFIETPYRSVEFLKFLTEILNETTLMTVASDLLTENQLIYTKSVKEWRIININELSINKTIFIIESK